MFCGKRSFTRLMAWPARNLGPPHSTKRGIGPSVRWATYEKCAPAAYGRPPPPRKGITDRTPKREQFLRGRRDHFSLVRRPRQVERARLALTCAARHRGRSIGAAADDFVESHLSLMAVRQADDGHAEMHEIGNDREQSHFLAAMLSCGRRECPADFAVQGAAHPQAAGLIEKARHLRGDAAEARRGADHDGVVVRPILDVRP